MIIRSSEREVSRAVRFNGRGEIALTHILPPGPEAFHGKGRLFSEVCLAPGEIFGTHAHHGDCEIFCILSGEGTYNDNGTPVKVGPGDVCICGDGEEHGMENTGGTDLRYIALILFT